MKSSNKPTVGEKACELLSQQAEPISLIDIQQEADKEFIKELESIIAKHRDFAPKYYIQVILKKERLLENVIRRYFCVRKSEPYPDYDTSLFSYDNRRDQLFYHWSIPDPTTCHYLLTHESQLSDDERPLLEMVKKFSEGIHPER